MSLWNSVRDHLKQPLSFCVDNGEQLDEEAMHTPCSSRKPNKKPWPEQTDLKGCRDHVGVHS